MSAPRPSDDAVQTILVVCTGNICRSPFVEVLLQEQAIRRGLPVLVRSAGVHGLEGNAAVSAMVDEARDRGIDLSLHRGAVATPSALGDADLVIAMTESHRSQLVRVAPGVRDRTFTMRELVRLLDAADEAPTDLVDAARIANRVRPLAPAAASREDVDDPYGGSREGYRRTAAELEELTSRLAAQLFDRRSDAGER